MNSNIEVLIAFNAFRKLRIWTDLAKGEVSGLGTVEEIRDKKGKLVSYLISDIDLIKQTSTSADTVLDDNAVNEYLYKLEKEGKDTSKVRLWWHSHGTINTFWSNTDAENIERLSNSGYLISLLTNKEEKLLCRIDVYHPFHITLDEVDVKLDLYEEDGIPDLCESEFNRKVIEPKEIARIPQHNPEPLYPGDTIDPWDFPPGYFEQMEML